MNPVFTIGYSTRLFSEFADLLNAHGVTVLCDVRSSPYSGRNPAFSRAELDAALRKLRIRYVFLGEEFGARPSDPQCYVNGQARYERIAQRAAFQAGIQRVLAGISKHRPVLMCAEREPTECHRTILVSRHLAKRSIEVRHIIGPNQCEAHEALERRLVRILGLEPPPMFATDDAWRSAIDEAYEVQGRKIAYVDKDDPEAPRSRAS
jgi:uncharacterized protein (DUF488 family)